MGLASKNAIHILVGIAAFIVLSLFLPASFSREASISIATVAIMIYWWIMRPVHISVTALLPIVVNSLFNIAPMPTILADYFNQIVVLLLGANIIIACWANSGLDKRIALLALAVIGVSEKRQIIVWFVLATVLSMFLPNAVVATMLCPIAAAMIKFSARDEKDLSNSKSMFLIMLAIVWGTGIGGFGTPLGGAMNLSAISYIEKLTGQEYMYITWTMKMLPYLIVLAIGTCVYLLLIKTDVKKLPGSPEYFKSEYKSIGKAKRSEIISLLLFLLAVVLSFARPLYQSILPEFKPYFAFLLLGVATFFLNAEKGKKLITWEYALKSINWGLIILFSGGLAAGNLLLSTGAAASIAQAVEQLNGNLMIISMAMILLSIFFSNVSSNTAAIAIITPIVIGAFTSMTADVLPYIYLTAAACNCAFVLPTSIRAIPVGYGLDIKFMFKKGMVAVLICFLLLCVTGYVYIFLLK